MYFLLQSEIETRDLQKGYIKKEPFCPYCGKTQIKKVDKRDLYTKYACWNKNCDNKSESFIVLNTYIHDEPQFDLECEFCQEPYDREFIVFNGSILLNFKCESKICE